MKKTTKLVSGLALLAVLTACSKKDSAEHYLDAQNYIANQQYSAAVIELRSAVQQSPDEYRYRLALGKALLGMHDMASAERELERALRYGAPSEDVALPLMRSYYLASNYQAAISAFDEDDALPERVQALIDSYRALAEIELGDTPSGLMHFERLSHSGDEDIAALASAHLQLSAQQPDAALAALDAITQDSELFAETLYLKGKIRLAQENIPAAIEHLNDYISLAPTKLLARLLLAQAYVRNGQFDDSEQHLALLLDLFPEQPMANYLQSLVSFQREDFEAAKTHSERAIRHGLVGSRARVIAAISSTQLGLEEQALRHLDPIRDQLHQIPEAQRLYVLLQLRAGEIDEAGKILSGMSESEQNLQLIASTAFELVRKGSLDSAESLLSQYQRHGELDAAGLTTIGTVKLGIESQRAAGISDLELALELDPTINQTRLVLAMTYLQQQEFEKASALAKEWIKDPEMQVAGYNLKAYAQFLQQAFDEAQQLTDKALQLKPLNPFSSLLQAMILVANDKLPAAHQQLKTMLDQHPQYLAGLEQYYAVSKSLQDTTDATKRIDTLFKQNEQIYPARLLRARVAFDQDDFQKVVDLLDASAPSQATPAMHYLLLIESHQHLDRQSAAVRHAERWHQQQPANVQAGYTYANALTLNNEREKALDLINSLLKNNPGHQRLLVAQITLLVQLQRVDQAVAVISNQPEAMANSPQMQFIKGRLELMRGNNSESIKAFQNSYAELPAHQTALFIAVNKASEQSDQAAQSFVERHIAEHGSDQNLDTYLASLLLKTDAEQAKSMYRDLLDAEPNNVVALNNYAWLLTEHDQAEKAKAYAQRAMELVPNHPDIIDTYGKVLLRLDQPHEALKQFEQSLSLRPDHAEVMLNYAEALSETNQKAKARDILSQVRSDDPAILERLASLQLKLK
ncbi:MAG: PEP-CTERM system TPR-repeat protein PrsT [Alkalimonas sp.]|nr:PEP-CTERM system TPR-repeat protein PrsT [Alkalimonas sp.]